MGASTAAHGREKRHFIARMERRIPGREFLIAGCHERGAVSCQFRKARDVLREKLLDRRAVDGFDDLLGSTGNFLQPSEEEDFHANRLGD